MCDLFGEEMWRIAFLLTSLQPGLDYWRKLVGPDGGLLGRKLVSRR